MGTEMSGLREEMREIQRDVSLMRESLARHMGEEEAQTKATLESIARIERMLTEYMTRQDTLLHQYDARIRELESSIAVRESHAKEEVETVKILASRVERLETSDSNQNLKLGLIAGAASIAVTILLPLIARWLGLG